jgi:hypothetical protein
MADLSDEEILAAEYLRELYGQVDGAPGGVVPAARLQQALGWEDAPFHQIGRLLHEVGLVRLLIGGIRLTAAGKATVEED